jgi:hypothetical protein
MMLLRPLAGYTLYDHKTKDSVRRELETECILDKIDKNIRNWLLHLQRKPPNRIPLKSYHCRPQGRRTIGRPKKRWREQLTLRRRNGSKEPILDVYDNYYYYFLIKFQNRHACLMEVKSQTGFRGRQNVMIWLINIKIIRTG